MSITFGGRDIDLDSNVYARVELENDVVELGFWIPTADGPDTLNRARIHSVHEICLIKRVAAIESFLMSIRDSVAEDAFQRQPGKMYRTSGTFAGYLVYQEGAAVRELVLESAVLTLRALYSGHVEWIDEPSAS